MWQIYFTERRTGILRRYAQLSDAAGSTLRLPAGEPNCGRPGPKQPSGRSLPALPEPERSEHDERSDDRGDDVAQRDPHAIEPGKQPQQPEQEAADKGANQAQPKVPPNAKAPAFASDDQPGNASAEQADDYPYDQLSK